MSETKTVLETAVGSLAESSEDFIARMNRLGYESSIPHE